MLHDILTVFLKEWNEYLHARGSKRGTIFIVFFPVLIFGIFMPLQAGREWVESPLPLVMFGWVPLLFVSAMIADSFAGERERHTLETLLVSRLSDSVILLGKYCAGISYGVLVTGLIVFTGLLTVNITQWNGSIVMYPLKWTLSGTAACVISSCLIAGIGVLVSLKAPTVRQAHQMMSFGIIAIAFLPSILVKLFFGRLSEGTRLWLKSTVNSLDPVSIGIAVAVVFLVLDAAVLFAAMKRFKRARMILD